MSLHDTPHRTFLSPRGSRVGVGDHACHSTKRPSRTQLVNQRHGPSGNTDPIRRICTRYQSAVGMKEAWILAGKSRITRTTRTRQSHTKNGRGSAGLDSSRLASVGVGNTLCRAYRIGREQGEACILGIRICGSISREGVLEFAAALGVGGGRMSSEY